MLSYTTFDNSSLDWQQAYIYDRFGNHSINTQNNATWGTGINSMQAAVDQNTTTNRMYAPNDPSHLLIDYDAAGNQTTDFYSGAGQRTYDAENRMIGAQDNSGGWTYYSYDGNGRRVTVQESTAATSNVFRWQVYGFDGELTADYNLVPGRGYIVSLTGEYGYRNGQLLVKATVGATVPSGGDNFETPNVHNGNYQYNPSGAGWTFTGSTGISGNGSALTSGNSNAPEGNQVGFIQGGSSSVISQQIGGLVQGASYAVTFSAAQRANCCGNGGEDFQVFAVGDLSGSVLIGTFRPGSTAYQTYSTTIFSPASGNSMGLRFVGLNSSGGDNMALIDDVRVNVIDNVEWMVSDHLGTPRMVFDKTGSLAGTKRHDYLPFGEELGAYVGQRTTTQGYNTPDGLRQQFTQKERDIETGLDYFGARYYASTQGRFTSPDDFLNDTHLRDPQSWNLYAYVRNNPLRYIDPDGTIKKDKDGNIIFDKTGEGTVTFIDKQPVLDKDGKPTGNTITITWTVDVGNVYADDGTKIEATKATSDMQVAVKDSKGKVLTEESAAAQKELKDGGYSNVADCHGTTFASGQVWINNDQAEKIIKGDHYGLTATPQAGDVGIFTSDGKLKNTVHSVLVNTTDSKTGGVVDVISKGGITPRVVTAPGPGAGAAWHDPNAKLQYFTQRVSPPKH